MVALAQRNQTLTRLVERNEAFSLTVALSLATVALDQFLHTSPAQFGASPAFQVFRWVGDTLITLPLVAAAVWLGHLIADRAGLRSTTRREVFQRALLISGLLAVLLIPGWFIHNEITGLTQGTDVSASHSHGAAHGADAYWVNDTVIYSLLLVPLVVVTMWAGYRIAARFRTRLTRTAQVLVRSSVIAVLLGGLATAAWYLHQAANLADSSRVLYTRSAQSVLLNSHTLSHGHGAHPAIAAPPVTAAPFSFAYQVARAVQDGLIAQVVGLPIAVLVLFWGASLLRDRNRYRQGSSTQEEVATR